MASELKFLPTSIAEMVENYGSNLRLALVEELEAENAIFVQDGNHGEYRPLQDEFVAHGVPFVRPGNLVDGRIDFSGCDRINEVAFQRVRKGIGKGGDIVLTTNATIGRVAITPLDASIFVTNPQTTVWRSTNPEILNQYYLFCFMRSSGFQEQLRTHTGRNATFDYISLTKQRSLTIPIPPLTEQKAIAGVLGALDDKIELNRRMNATLEAMARALFQSWFVDFDPVRAKLDGRPPTNLDPATAALFPDSFQDSPLGPIPKGWNVSVLDDLTDFVIGGDWGQTDPTETESVACYCIRGADIPSLQEGGVGKMPTRFLKPSSVEKRQLQDGDLVVEISGGSPTQSTGRPVLVSTGLLRSLGKTLVASNFCRIVKLKNPSHSKFLYLWLRHLYSAGEFNQFENGTTGIKNFAFTLFASKYRLVVPSLPIAEAFDKTVSPLFARIQSNAHQSHTLATLRDTLLPKLLSRELSVTETH